MRQGWFLYERPDRFCRLCPFEKFSCDRVDNTRTLHRRSLTSAATGAITITWIARVLFF